MAISRPNIDELKEIAKSIYIDLTDAEAKEYLALMQANFDAYDVVDELDDNINKNIAIRDKFYRPTGDENPLNAWYYKTNIVGASTGLLKGKTIALKDNISLANIPMMNGSETLEGFIPTYDATIVTRMLNEGATIAGKATCEHFCLSGGSHTSDPAPVHNPHKYGYAAGGSSSGSAALVANGDVDMAIACDQGGSIRIPSSFCGVYGMKPTHGLVPYTGIMPIENTIDHAGPVTTTVKDNAVLLEVLAGIDYLDPRQYAPKVDQYSTYLNKDISGLKIGVVKEGFDLPNMDSKVAEKVYKAADIFKKLGAIVEEVSLPEHKLAGALWSPIGCEGLTAQMMHGNGMGFNWKGQYDIDLMEKHKAWRTQTNKLAPSLIISMLVGQFGINQYDGKYYAKAQNLARKATLGYEKVLDQYDVLLMPTVPIVAQKLPTEDASITEYITKAFEMIGNTAPLDITGHPAMTVPCGLVDGLPVGMMLIAKHYAEGVIYQTASAYESAVNWKDC
ncbi:amidase [Acinetobacter nectaris]|uniref:amidase n=1 Tax=Acinetobacter nectaris TaxID=1219382 RepID=UPI001F384CD1|nr:amidase [Acinetobacter nectaris]MCF8999175.1 amidase [Acinetobacter nectaris]MCF9026500.1 amidase [Acinetobacter nectaris]